MGFFFPVGLELSKVDWAWLWHQWSRPISRSQRPFDSPKKPENPRRRTAETTAVKSDTAAVKSDTAAMAATITIFVRFWIVFSSSIPINLRNKVFDRLVRKICATDSVDSSFFFPSENDGGARFASIYSICDCFIGRIWSLDGRLRL